MGGYMDMRVGQTAIERLRFHTEDGRETGPADWQGRRALLVFLRWLG